MVYRILVAIAIILCAATISSAQVSHQKENRMEAMVRQFVLETDSMETHLAYLKGLISARFINCRIDPDAILDSNFIRNEPYVGMLRTNLIRQLQGSDVIDTDFKDFQVFAQTRFGNLRAYLEAYFDSTSKVIRLSITGGVPSKQAVKDDGFKDQLAIAHSRFGAAKDSSDGVYYRWYDGHTEALLSHGHCIKYEEVKHEKDDQP